MIAGSMMKKTHPIDYYFRIYRMTIHVGRETGERATFLYRNYFGFSIDLFITFFFFYAEKGGDVVFSIYK